MNPSPSAYILMEQHRDSRVVVCAAMRSDFTGDIVIGIRHYDAFMNEQINAGPPIWGDPTTQGFVDQWGIFMDRKEALEVAAKAGQINTRRPKTNPVDELFSEDLY